MIKHEVIYWETGARAIVTRSWSSKTAAISDMENKAEKFRLKPGNITRKGETRIEWTSKNGKRIRAYYVRTIRT